LKAWQGPERPEDHIGGETRLEDAHSRAGMDVRAARFGKTFAAAASNRREADDHLPWTHVPAQNGEQSRNALGRWLQRWLGLALGPVRQLWRPSRRRVPVAQVPGATATVRGGDAGIVRDRRHAPANQTPAHRRSGPNPIAGSHRPCP
jgi:hypothetical protein